MATRLPVDLIVGTTPAAGVTVRCPENATRIRAYNLTNQWVHITAPIDQYVAPGQTGASYVIVHPTAGFLTLTALFEAPGGWTQAGSIANQKCTLTVESDDSPFAGDFPGVLAVTPNVYAEHFEDDCDPAHPYTARFYIPTSIQLAKAITVSYLAAAYRYYVSTATMPSGGGSTGTTVGGGSGVGTDTQLNLTSGNHQHTQTDTGSPGSSTDSTGSSAHTTDAQGVHNHGTNSVSDTEYASHDHATGVFSFITNSPHSHLTTNDGSHSHNVNTHTHSHSHTTTHNHTMTGQPADGAHTHPHSHTITTTHTHSVTFPDHTHAITVNPGVIEELTAASWTLAVDGNAVAAPPLNATDLDLVPYVTKDANGNPATGWHTIRWTPNQRSRVLADLVVQLYLAAF